MEAIATDDALDVLELLVKDLLSCSAREGKKERLRTLKDLDAAALQLSQVGRVLLDLNCDDEKVREKVWRLLLDKLEEPDSYLLLKQQVEALLPHVDLPEVLLEIQVKTGFMDEFIHINESFARVRDLSTSICAVLIASACNIGLTPLVRPDVPALTRPRLTWVEQNYIRPETLVRANARLVDAQAQIPLAQSWGGGEVASADGLRFIVPVRTLNTELSVWLMA